MLQQRLREQGEAVDKRTLARLTDPDRPVKRAQMRVAGAICRALGIDLDDLFTFAPALREGLQQFPSQKEARLHELMHLHSEGELNSLLLPELEALVDEVYALQMANLHKLVEYRQRLEMPAAAHPHAAAGVDRRA